MLSDVNPHYLYLYLTGEAGKYRATCVTLWKNVTCATLQRYGKMLNGQTLKSATSDYDQRHVIAFRPISAAARSWSYDKTSCIRSIMQTTWPFTNLTQKCDSLPC